MDLHNVWDVIIPMSNKCKHENSANAQIARHADMRCLKIYILNTYYSNN